MALTKICGSKKLAAGSVTTSELADGAITGVKIADLAVSTAKVADAAVTALKIADAAVTSAKVDAADSYTVANVTVDSDSGDNNKVIIAGNGAITTMGGEFNVQNAAGDTSFLKVDVAGVVSTSSDANVGGALNVAGDAVIQGDLTVNGTTTSVNSTDTDITDKNITLAKGGDAAAAEGAGITVERTDATDGSLLFSDNYVTKWAVGLVGAEVEVVDISTAQTLSNKTYSLTGASIEGKSDLEAAIRAVDDKLSTGAAYKTVETDTADSNFTNGDKLALGEAVLDGSIVKVWESGMRLRSGSANDFTIDYANGEITFLDAPCAGANIIVEYLPA